MTQVQNKGKRFEKAITLIEKFTINSETIFNSTFNKIKIPMQIMFSFFIFFKTENKVNCINYVLFPVQIVCVKLWDGIT